MRTILLLVASNALMTVAWYGHLKWPNKPLWLVVLASWGIAFFEYCFAVPANRYGHVDGLTLGQLKVTQEVITLLVFGVFAVLAFGERLTWRHAGAFACLWAPSPSCSATACFRRACRPEDLRRAAKVGGYPPISAPSSDAESGP